MKEPEYRIENGRKIYDIAATVKSVYRPMEDGIPVNVSEPCNHETFLGFNTSPDPSAHDE